MELPKFGADGDYGKETESAVSQFKQELSEIISVEDVSTELDIQASGEVDNRTAEAIKELLRQAFSGERWKLPNKSDPEVEVPEDQMALYRKIVEENGIPPYFAVRRSRR